jgi:hypothetical protein
MIESSGHDLNRKTNRIKRLIGFFSQEPALFPTFSAWDKSAFFSRIRPSEPTLKESIVALGLLSAPLVLYLRTMAPDVLDGDSALFQYAPRALAVTYPTGYPLYILLGKLWTTLVPLGNVAYRMNLLSAVLGALSVPVIYQVIRRIVEDRPIAAIAALLFAALPTYWFWALSAKIYTLNILLIAVLFHLLLRWGQIGQEPGKPGAQSANLPIYLFTFLYGLSLTNYSPSLLLAPSFLLFLWLHDRRLFWDARRLVLLTLLFILPLGLYLYIPLRGEQLLHQAGEVAGLGMPTAVAQGLVSDYYRPTLTGLMNYFLAQDFTAVIATSWADILGHLEVYLHFLRHDFGAVGIALGLVGLVVLLRTKPKLTASLLLLHAVVIPFTLKYSTSWRVSMMGVYLLPTDLVFTIWVASAVTALTRILGRWWPARRHLTRSAVTLAFACLPIMTVVTHFAALDHSQDYATSDYWRHALAHPLENGAGLVAHWGDLTSMWYMQQGEGQRPDLFGLFPPQEEMLGPWVEAGHALYIAGPLQGWWPEASQRYRLTPWGLLVKVDPLNAPAIAFPPPQHPSEANFGDKLKLLGYEVDQSVVAGQRLSLRLYWRTLETVGNDHMVSLRLLDGQENIVSQKDDRLMSAWYLADALTEDQAILDAYRLAVPASTPPGQYSMQMVVYSPVRGEELVVQGTGSTVLELGPVTIPKPE